MSYIFCLFNLNRTGAKCSRSKYRLLTLGGQDVGRPDVADEPRDGDGDAAHALDPELKLVHEDDGGVAEL